jgi:hypothetical protein
MFADDTSLTTTGNTLQEVNTNLQKDLDNVNTWCMQNAMVLNAQKSKAMHLSIKSTKTDNKQPPTLFHNNQEIEYTNTEKLLGMYVDINLKWKTQVQSTIKNATHSCIHFLDLNSI